MSNLDLNTGKPECGLRELEVFFTMYGPARRDELVAILARNGIDNKFAQFVRNGRQQYAFDRAKVIAAQSDIRAAIAGYEAGEKQKALTKKMRDSVASYGTTVKPRGINSPGYHGKVDEILSLVRGLALAQKLIG